MPRVATTCSPYKGQHVRLVGATNAGTYARLAPTYARLALAYNSYTCATNARTISPCYGHTSPGPTGLTTGPTQGLGALLAKSRVQGHVRAHTPARSGTYVSPHIATRTSPQQPHMSQIAAQGPFFQSPNSGCKCPDLTRNGGESGAGPSGGEKWAPKAAEGFSFAEKSPQASTWSIKRRSEERRPSLNTTRRSEEGWGVGFKRELI